MELSDLTVEVRDINLNRVGQIRHEELDLQLQAAFNNVGTWLIRLPPEHPLAPTLRTPGSGIIVTGPNGPLFSGPMTNTTYESSPTDPAGTITIEGVSDDIILRDHLSIPQPSNADLTTQNVAHDTRTGYAEDLMHAYVNANIGPSAPAGRKKANLTMGTSGARGPSVTKKPRFPILGELLDELALVGGLGFKIIQSGTVLVFETYAITDRTDTVRLDVLNGELIGQKVQISPPGVTRVLVAGQEEGVNRQFVYRDNATSLAAETEWGRRIERFLDQRQTDVVAELETAADEVLAEEGFTGIAAQTVPAEGSSMQFGTDWNLGDKVVVITEGQELTTTVVGFVVKANAEGYHFGAVTGDPTQFDREGAYIKRVGEVEDRVAQIERNVEVTDPATFVAKTGGVMTGDLTVDKTGTALVAAQGSTGAYLRAIGPAGTYRALQFNTQDAGNRFTLGLNSDAETGSDAGSNLYLAYCDDTGAYKANAITLYRDTGKLYLSAHLVLNNATNGQVRLAVGQEASVTDLSVVNEAATAYMNLKCATPTLNQHATTKAYVDGKVVNTSTGSETDKAMSVNASKTYASSRVLNTMAGTETDKAPSVNSVKSYVAKNSGTMTPYAAWTDYGSGYAGLYCTRVGDVVALDFLVKPTSDYSVSSGSFYGFGTIPSGYRPAHSLIGTAVINTNLGMHIGRVNVSSSGEIQLVSLVTGTIYASGGWVAVNVSYRGA